MRLYIFKKEGSIYQSHNDSYHQFIDEMIPNLLSYKNIIHEKTSPDKKNYKI